MTGSYARVDKSMSTNPRRISKEEIITLLQTINETEN